MSAAKIAASLRCSPGSANSPSGTKPTKPSRCSKLGPLSRREASSLLSIRSRQLGAIRHHACQFCSNSCGQIEACFIAPHDRFGSKPEVNGGHENDGCWGQSGSRFRATGCLFIATSRSLQLGQDLRWQDRERLRFPRLTDALNGGIFGTAQLFQSDI